MLFCISWHAITRFVYSVCSEPHTQPRSTARKVSLFSAPYLTCAATRSHMANCTPRYREYETVTISECSECCSLQITKTEILQISYIKNSSCRAKLVHICNNSILHVYKSTPASEGGLNLSYKYMQARYHVGKRSVNKFIKNIKPTDAEEAKASAPSQAAFVICTCESEGKTTAYAAFPRPNTLELQ